MRKLTAADITEAGYGLGKATQAEHDMFTDIVGKSPELHELLNYAMIKATSGNPQSALLALVATCIQVGYHMGTAEFERGITEQQGLNRALLN